MKKNYSVILILAISCVILLGIGSNKIYAQRFVNVTPGFGTLNTAIDGDTTALGTRKDLTTIYVLQRGGLYLLNGTILNRNYELRIQAASGTGARPIIQPAVPQGGASTPPFNPYGNISLKGLYITDTDELGKTLDRIIRVQADSVRIKIDDCHLDNATQAAIRLDSKWTKVYLTNSIVSNMGRMASPDNGRGVDDRGNEIDTLVFENSSFYNLTSRILRDGGGIINYARVNHCTLVNIAQRGCTIGEAIKTYFTNNLVINAGFLGRDPLVDKRSVLEISRLGADKTNAGIKQVIVVENNNFWIDPALVAVQPTPKTEPVTVFDPVTAILVDSLQTNKKVLNEAIVLTKAPALPTQVVTDYWNTAVVTKPDMDQGAGTFGTTPFTFTYATTKSSYTFGTSSQPLGALTWFGIAVGVKDNITTIPTGYELSANYPNPFNPSTTIHFTLPERAQVKLVVFNSLGQEVASLVNETKESGSYSVVWNGKSENGIPVPSGIYFYRIDAGNFSSTHKMVLLK